jgi:ribosomal protein S18 acetylase RimI-like enzyme
LKEYSHDDPDLQEYAETLEPYVGGYNARKIPYQVFVHKQEVVGFVVVSVEPVRMLEPIGTPMSIVLVIDYSQPVQILKDIADNALRIAKERKLYYSFIDIPEEHHELVDYFLSIGYTEIAHSLRMSCPLADYVHGEYSLRFVKAKREEVHDFIESIKKSMSGSKDTMINIVLDNIADLPQQFLDHWYNSTSLYNVYDGKTLVGILELSPQVLNISNIGIAPEHRRKGYGKQIMHYAFSKLKEEGYEFARLRVHADNENAIHLYESFGMKKEKSYKALIWRKD